MSAIRIIGGYTWHCRKPGSMWATGPTPGYELEWRTREPGGDTGWHLYGPGYFGEHVGVRFSDALRTAATLIAVEEGPR